MMGPSKNLSWKELACKDGTPYPNEWRNNRAIILSGVFELIRNYFGSKPITVLSAFRTFEHNRKIGGARKSQHLKGRALDLRPPIGISIKEFYDGIKSLAPFTAIGGIGLYKTFVHVDIRISNKVVYWRGEGVKDAS